ncbi:hypothetical protein EG19_09385 [Thermoanaerobaculum aquaticum]|uniref:RHS repeat-associated core domain-containing protein n=2 Tax=Thermoanaerobaculum aquaticum TaxID=1312852 RepID=A0A062XWI7_9BACT|nr:hypothetical protein EG19_09385 [Thermoanaerobaculum aquaticum]
MFCNPNIHGNLTNYAGRALPVLGTTNRLASASYDASGNLTSWAGFSYTWDVVNQMTGMQGNGLSRRFAYTAAGERMLEWDQNRYIVSVRGLAGEVLREVTYSYGASSNSWQVFWGKDTVWAGGRLLASVSRNQGIQHYHVDRLGSPRMVTNRCGQRMKTFDHNPWGMDRFAGMQDGERHRFTAHQRDLGNLTRSWDDVDYMHARYYTGYLARFLSPDPVRGDVLSPQSFNLFSYVRGNPINFEDPWGLMASGAVASGNKEECKTDVCVDVNAADPCPGAPAGVSCEAWKAFKEMQLQMLLDRYRWSFSGNCGSFAGAVCPTQRNHWVAGQSDPTLVILREVGKLEPVTSGMTMLVSEATVIVAGGMAIEAVPPIALKTGAGGYLQLSDPVTGRFSGPTLQALVFRASNAPVSWFLAGWVHGFNNGPIPFSVPPGPAAYRVGYGAGQAARFLVGW